VKAGIDGGFRVFGLANGYNNSDLEEEGAMLFYTYEELSDIIGV
jgi:hypothetical protein